MNEDRDRDHALRGSRLGRLSLAVIVCGAAALLAVLWLKPRSGAAAGGGSAAASERRERAQALLAGFVQRRKAGEGRLVEDELLEEVARIEARAQIGGDELLKLRGLLTQPVDAPLPSEGSGWSPETRAKIARTRRFGVNSAVMGLMGHTLVSESPGDLERRLILDTFRRELFSPDPAAREAALLSLWDAALLDDPSFYDHAVGLMGDSDERVSHWAKLKLAQWPLYRVQWYRGRNLEAPNVRHLPGLPGR